MNGAPLWLAIVTTLVALAMALAPALQLGRILTRRSSADVSVSLFAVVALGTGLWCVYGIYENDWPLIIANGVSAAMNLATVMVALHFRTPDAR